MGGISPILEGPGKSKASKTHLGLSSLGDLYQEKEPHNIRLQEPANRGAMGKQESSLKGTVHKLTCSKSKHRDSSLKGTCVIHERDILMNFRVSVGRFVRVLWGWRH